MSGRLQLIEQKLAAIDSAAFQNLCDIYLAQRESLFLSYSRTGSQIGKQKTVKGTPDTFFRLSNGALQFIEYTTTNKSVVSKIKDDIDKCAEESKTGISLELVNKIIVCFNSRLDLVQEAEIMAHANTKDIKIELIGIDTLALDIFFKFPILQKDPLGMPIETGQLLPVENFIKEYNNKAGAVSTPLDNEFLHRANELNKLSGHLSNSDLIVISGFPGVGKTKIALQATNNFVNENNGFTAYAVSKKDVDISADLRIQLIYGQKYILLIDDANRQLMNFSQILGLYKERPAGSLKLLITVRDYALRDIELQASEFMLAKMTINKFTDEEIKELISSESFGILNPKYQRDIIAIADGNARLAIMASRLAKEKNHEYLYGGKFELIDDYFKSFIKDNDILEKPSVLATLGLISFFYTIYLNNKALVNKILQDFEIDQHDFNEAIKLLEDKELIDVQFNHIRISEQVMAIYFFYKVFIKDNLLSFETLMFNYFTEWKKRFSDSIIPANNSYGYHSVLDKIQPTLNSYLTKIKDDELKLWEFLELFWFYTREQTLSFLFEKVKLLPEPVSSPTVYKTTYDHNDFVWDADKILGFTGKFFNNHTESLMPAIMLAFEYVRKKPECSGELLKKIREQLMFDEDDDSNGYLRQLEFMQLVISEFDKGNEPYRTLFFPLADSFLSHSFQITKSGGKNSFVSYQYPFPFYEETQDFRGNIWKTLLSSYSTLPEEALGVISNYRTSYGGTNIDLLEFDLQFLLPFLHGNLDESKFKHIIFVDELVSKLDREPLGDRSYRNLKERFTNDIFIISKKLDWNMVKGKQDFDFENHDDFEALKKQEIKESFIFTENEDFEPLINAIEEMLVLDKDKAWGIQASLNIITDQAFAKNAELGFELFITILKKFYKDIQPIYLPFQSILSSGNVYTGRLWEILILLEMPSGLYWKIMFFKFLPPDQITNFYVGELKNTIGSISGYATIHLKEFEIYDTVVPNTTSDIFKSIVDLNASGNAKIDLWFSFFIENADMLKDDYNYLLRAYLQQDEIKSNYDTNKGNFKAIFDLNPEFLIDYLREVYSKGKRGSGSLSRTSLAFVWDHADYFQLVTRASEIIVGGSAFYGFREHALGVFFTNLKEEQKAKALAFIMDYILKNNSDSRKMDAILKVLRHYVNEFYDECFLYYLSLNQDPENFKKITWINDGGTYNGNVIIGDVHAKNWERLLSVVEMATNQLYLIPIKAVIRENINHGLASGDRERARMFSRPD